MQEAVSVVVVGGGAPGCLVAARLAEAHRKVVLVEAGPNLRAGSRHNSETGGDSIGSMRGVSWAWRHHHRRPAHQTPGRDTVGTCAMGAFSQHGAVVGAAGQVHGIDGLYVADASILPGPPTGFPHLVVLMIAGRIADGLVRRQHLAEART